MSNDAVESLLETLHSSATIARALLPTIPISDRKHLYSWIGKLTNGRHTVEELKNHTEYLWYLLTNLEEATILPPFTNAPPVSSLPPLCTVLPQEVYSEVLEGVDTSILSKWLEGSAEEQAGGDASKEEEDDGEAAGGWKLSPENFFPSMPRPRDGAFCYACVFATKED